ncbi:hypothetical protein CFN78_08375 [Amycolatopsis antarctica]|uniref:Integral membrane protein n=1 Tax=Amycolatopsis antarctica TaxID=1854586 RepID=A0A263D7T5_9PSEU|nr:hypothetical protein [Amycolatopsis antarctica]OZM73546.1 hypothetical protein CFN78_08375 [Amycolatopsis antarctica]
MSTVTAEVGRKGDLLRVSLRIDGWGTAAFGVLMLVAGPWLPGPLGLPASWFVPIGIAMLGGAIALGLISGCPVIPARYARVAVAANAALGVALLPVAFAGVLPLTALGVGVVVLGAAWVLTFAALEYTGIRRATA